MVDGQQTGQKESDDCFSITTTGEGAMALHTIQGEETAGNFSLSYYEEGNMTKMAGGDADILRFLTIKIGNTKSEWRANKGHLIYKIEKPDTLAFFFSENLNKERPITGTIVFSK